MADRYLVSEVQQVGIESVLGTPVVPTIQFQGLSVDLDTELEVDEFGPSGQIVNSIVASRQEWSSGSLSGFPTYTELPYVFANLFGAATVTTPSGATDARLWRWQPDKSATWTPKTWTLRRGVPGGTAEEASYLLLSGLGLVLSRTDAPEVSGDLFAQRLNYAASPATTGVTSRANQPILPGEVDIYLDPDGASLGSTKLLRDFRYEIAFSDFFSNIWPLNSALPSFAAHSVQKPSLETTLQLGNDAAGRALVASMRAGSTVFVRMLAQAPADSIEAGFRFSLQIDSALKVVDAPSRGDVEGLSTLEWTLRNVYDATWTHWIDIQVMTNFASF
jgi:hypothetical protein